MATGQDVGLPRLAGAPDEPLLRRLARECPMVGPVSYRVEREPDFFALTRLQGFEPAVAVVEAHGGTSLAAMGTSVRAVRRLASEPVALRYFADLKVHPEHRGRGLAGRLMELGREQLVRERTSAIALVLAGNPSMSGVTASESSGLRFRRLARLRSYNAFIGRAPDRPSAVHVREARRSELEELSTVWNRSNADRTLTWEYTPATLERDLTRAPGMGLERTLVAERAGRVTGFAVVWDAAPVKQVRLLRLSPGLRFLRRLYNPAARWKNRAPIPSDSELLRFVYVTRFCAESPADFRALLTAAHDRSVEAHHLYLDVALDVRDPLTVALDGFFKTTVDFDVYLVTPSGMREVAVSPRPVYFDLADA